MCVSFVGAVVYGGTRAVSGVCRLLLFGSALSYLAMLSLGLPHVQGQRLLYADWSATLATLPILLVCFGYQNLIPTLTYYTQKNIKALRTAIFVGNLIPFLIYFLWNFVILGLLPQGIACESHMVTGLLEKASESESVLFFAIAFSFCAILTPFIANTLTFVDFLKDGLKTSKELAIYGLVLIPPTLLTLFYPNLFLKALGIAGGFADVILFGLLPVSIVWIGRYHKNAKGPFTAPGGKLFLIIVLLFSLGFLL